MSDQQEIAKPQMVNPFNYRLSDMIGKQVICCCDTQLDEDVMVGLFVGVGCAEGGDGFYDIEVDGEILHTGGMLIPYHPGIANVLWSMERIELLHYMYGLVSAVSMFHKDMRGKLPAALRNEKCSRVKDANYGSRLKQLAEMRIPAIEEQINNLARGSYFAECEELTKLLEYYKAIAAKTPAELNKQYWGEDTQ